MKHYRHQITINAVTQTLNEFGDPVETWAELDTVWGLVLPVSGGEVVEAGQTVTREKVSIEIYYLSTVTTKHQVVFGDKTYQIDYIENVNNLNRWMKLNCTETV
ncbi:phage head closure protein [Candidatus Pacearchaeota archaeon]|jgi:SPP1 family predicted phage head-tail adaptor|nr:phage head closure protein [Candidatus Pacearchaeota archaeon]